MLPDKRIEIYQEGMLWGRNHVIARYSFDGDELLLAPSEGSGVTLRCKRVR